MDTDKERAGQDANLFRAVVAHMRREVIVPQCFDSDEQFQRWIEPAMIAPPRVELLWCEDCTQEHQEKMIAQGRCLRADDVTFNTAGQPQTTSEARVQWFKASKRIRDNLTWRMPDV